MGSIKDQVAIIGMGLSKFGENWESSSDDMIIEATYEAYEDAGIGPKDIQAAFVGTIFSGVTAACVTEPLKLDYLPVTRVENNCASGLEALRVASFSIACGMYDNALVVGFEKLKDCGYSSLPNPSQDSLHPLFGSGVTGPGSFALAATRYFHKYGISMDDGKRTLAKIAVKNHHNGSFHPKAMYQREVTLEAVINAPPIAWPLGLFDCCPTTDGAAAAILTRADLAKSFRDDYVLVKGLGLSVGRINPWTGKCREDVELTFWVETDIAAKQAYDQAGVKDPRKEISMAEVHDCFTITELINYESLGFAPVGKGKEDVDAGTFTLEGQLPVNTDGGLKAFGHPIGASGIRMACECYKQLQGKAGRRQVKNPTLGLAHSQGGIPGAFEGSVAIFGARD
ncbi:acetyl-CoA acetyltransferase [Chloroflexota bacterium]